MEKAVKPWGYYRILSQTLISKNDPLRFYLNNGSEPRIDEKILSQTKVLFVNPYSALSLQSHEKRSEHWTFLDGEAKIIVGCDNYDARPGDTFFIPQRFMHRITTNEKPCKVLEVAVGEIDENDIFRVEDQYGRTNKDFLVDVRSRFPHLGHYA